MSASEMNTYNTKHLTSTATYHSVT